MSSLQDQLLKAGLVNDKQVKKVKKDKRKTDKVQRKSKEVVVDETKAQVAKTRAEKTERDRQLNEERKAEADRKAIAAQVKQLIEMNRQPKGGGDTAYNFTDGKQIKKIFVSGEVLRLLERGRLAIARLGESYELIPAVVAEKISQRDEGAIISCHTPDRSVDDEDDPYADYQIPDDLMW